MANDEWVIYGKMLHIVVSRCCINIVDDFASFCKNVKDKNPNTYSIFQILSAKSRVVISAHVHVIYFTQQGTYHGPVTHFHQARLKKLKCLYETGPSLSSASLKE